MKLTATLLFLFLCSAVVSSAQPAWSPEVRANRETQWVRDSLHLSPEQLNKVIPINLDYERNMDKAANKPDQEKVQKHLGQRKDAEMKAILNKEQYSKYYKREKLIRERHRVKYSGPNQPL